MPAHLETRREPPGRTQLPAFRDRLAVWMCATFLAALSAAFADTVLTNESYAIRVEEGGALLVTPRGGKDVVFRPEFTVLIQDGPLAVKKVKWDQPVYNLIGWELPGGKVVRDVFQIGRKVVLRDPVVTVENGLVRWKFSDPALDLTAEVSLPEGGGDPVLKYTAAFREAAVFSLAYTGAPALPLKDVAELWQPLVWDGRRLPPESFLIGDDHCSIPGCLVQGAAGTVGVMADPWQFPFVMPNEANRRFGVVVRNADGLAQPLVFAPFPGAKNSRFESGQSFTFVLRLVARPENLNATFEHVARAVCGFRDRRENTLGSLNQTLDNIIEFATSPAGSFVPESRSFHYPDAAGTVKNVSALHPLALGLVTDNEALFRGQGIPILEYLMSREKFLFALSEEAMKSTQTPSMKMAGPAMPVSELAALERMSNGASPVFRDAAQRLGAKDRMLNMEWLVPADSWQNDLALYRATGDKARLAAARRKADEYIAKRIETAPADFSEAGSGTFFDYMTPWWKDLYELYLETGEPCYLEAAHRGARRYAQFVWFYPSVPDAGITVNEDGFAPRRGSEKPGLVPAKPETVPAWRVSEQGLICEGNGTVARLGILLSTHAPYFLRIARDTDDPFLREIARSAVIGRYAGFPGYHVNTRYSTAQEKADFPYHPHEELRATTSFHYNHSLPMANMVLDYLMAEAYDRSRAAVNFPSEYAEGYAYLGSLVYGDAGTFYGTKNVRPWMPKGLVSTDSVQVNYVSGRWPEGFCLALMNESTEDLKPVTVILDSKRFQNDAQGDFAAEVWRDNIRSEETLRVVNGRFQVPVSARGITAIVVKGLVPKAAFQDKVQPVPAPAGARTHQRVTGSLGDGEAMILSFGPEITWLYAYLSANGNALKSAQLTVRSGGKETVLKDDAFPFEFTLPVSADARVEGVFEGTDHEGRTQSSDPFVLSREK